MSKKDDGNIIIGANVIDRIMNLCERGFDKMENQEKETKFNATFSYDFIKEQMVRIQEEMKNTDVLDEKYKKLASVYGDLYRIVKW